MSSAGSSATSKAVWTCRLQICALFSAKSLCAVQGNGSRPILQTHYQSTQVAQSLLEHALLQSAKIITDWSDCAQVHLLCTREMTWCDLMAPYIYSVTILRTMKDHLEKTTPLSRVTKCLPLPRHVIFFGNKVRLGFLYNTYKCPGLLWLILLCSQKENVVVEIHFYRWTADIW